MIVEKIYTVNGRIYELTNFDLCEIAQELNTPVDDLDDNTIVEFLEENPWWLEGGKEVKE